MEKEQKSVENLVYLNPKGKIMDMLKSLVKQETRKPQIDLRVLQIGLENQENTHPGISWMLNENELYGLSYKQSWNLKKNREIRIEFHTRLQSMDAVMGLFP
jgi:hypothetical protein